MPVNFVQTSARMLTGVTIAKWVSYINYRYTPGTNIHYKNVLWRFKEFAPQNIEQLTAEHIEAYLNHLARKGFTPRTCNNHLIAIRSFCRWLAECHGLPNPSTKVRNLRTSPPRQRVLSAEEYQSVLVICTETEADIIRFLGNTGLRASEAQSLRWGNVSPDLRYLTITGKGRKRRIVPLNETCRSILAKDDKSSNHIYFLKSYQKRNTLNYLCFCLSRRAAIPRFGPHALRHFLATSLMQKGVPLIKISKILGHASIRTTEQIYIHWTHQDIIGVTDILD